MIDPFESYEKKVSGLKDDVRNCRRALDLQQTILDDTLSENRRLRDACRQTNKGIHRLSKRCASQAKKIVELKAIVREAVAEGDAPQHWVEAVNGRRPAEKAT